ncbi:CGNR zinc finger domain-containing protein [Streptosporangium sp. CA-135522]|uniref:CGNR zinc finger domain-containing protein n=1 Tax=Streptosporangium sp. CA-135522 TaxID=3240072 RepID=UPI003D937595
MNNPSDLVCDFVNSYDVESGADAIPSPAALAAWLGRRGLIGPADTAGDDDLAAAVELRESLRAALRRNHAPGHAPDGDPDGAPTGEPGGEPTVAPWPGVPHSFAGLPLRMTLTTGGPVLEPVHTGVPGGLARIAAAVLDTRADGTWPRLKVCTESTCQWAFVDLSKNRSRSWCSMKVCGNRTKTRAYRARRQPEAGSRHP